MSPARYYRIYGKCAPRRRAFRDRPAGSQPPNIYAEANLRAGDEVIREVDKIFADSIRTVKSLYSDGILKKPEGWKYAPDLLQFYEAKSAAEQELYLIFLEYRQRAFQGAFHNNPDYMHWYGWAKVKEAAARIREDAERLRKEHKKM